MRLSGVRLSERDETEREERGDSFIVGIQGFGFVVVVVRLKEGNLLR